MKRWMLILLIIVVILGVAVWFFVFRKSGQYAVMQAIPKDAVFVVETPSFNRIYDQLRRNKIWESLKAYPAFAEYHSDFQVADSLCNAHSVLRKMIADRPVAVSCHMVSGSAFDMLYVCDLGKLNVIKAFEGALASVLEDYQVKIREKGVLKEVSVGDVMMFYVIKGNLLMVSFSELLVQQAFDNCDQVEKKEPEAWTGDVGLRVNHKQLNRFMNSALQMGQQVDGVSAFMTTLLGLRLTDKSLVFTGETNPNRSEFSLWSALNLIEGNESELKEIAGNNTAAYISLCFSSFSELESVLMENYKANSLKDYQEYEQTLDKINKYLKLNVLELFTSWIGTEIAVIKPAVDKEKRLDNLVIAIRSKDIDLAKDQLGYLTEQIERKTPVRFKAIEYNGHTINFLSLKGFFNLFFGQWFNKFDRPYYTFIGDYVVFSNSSATLATMIKDYSLGNTLEKNEKYHGIMNEVGSGNNVYGYVNASNAYEYLYESFKPESRSDFAKNKGAFLSFESIAFSLVNADGVFSTRIVADHNVNASEEHAVKELSKQLEDLADEIESGYYNPLIPDSIAVSTRGDYAYQTELFSYAGALNDGDLDGVWSVKNAAGILVAQLTYQKGVLVGESHFFYPGGTVQAQVSYEKNKITAYKEFFPDGTLRMEMEYNKGVRHGETRFYYSTGHLRGEGKYRKGERTGTWKYYRVTGETERKMKF